ncbi:MAG: cyanophycinase [Planctomycetota bacterium]
MFHAPKRVRRRRRLGAFALLVLGVLLAARNTTPASRALNAASAVANEDSRAASFPRGHLVIIGGGGTPLDVVERILTLAGGSAAQVVVLPQASERAEAGAESLALWRERGASRVSIVDLAEPAVARELLCEATLIWFPGGDQTRLMKALEDAGLTTIVRDRYRDGAVIAGTSAGAAVMSHVMITGDADLENVHVGTTATAGGIGLWPEAIVDQHFHQRRRFNRLLSALYDHSALLGVGIDERTAVHVHGRELEVLGESSVLILDARGATRAECEARTPAALRDVRLHLLKSGMRFDWAAPVDTRR